MKRRTSDMLFHTAGGRVALTVLRRAAELSLVHGDGRLGLGSRQELAITGVAPESRNSLRQGIGGLLPEHHPRRPNIVTTRAATGMAQRTPWLSEGAYDHVLESFTAPPAIPVNLIDPRQCCMPRYTGQLHALASREPEFWHVGFNTAPQGPPAWLAPAVHSAGVAGVIRLIQQALVGAKGPDLARLHAQIEQQFQNHLRELTPGPPATPASCVPTTGFTLDVESGRYSLAIPALSQGLPCSFLVDLAVLGRRLAIATACVSPWKSLLVHGIPAEERDTFETLLLRYRINLAPGSWETFCFNDFRTPGVRQVSATLLRALNETFPHPGPLRIAFVEHPAITPELPILVRAEIRRGASWPLWSQAPRFSLFMRETFGPEPGRLQPIATGLGVKELTGAVLAAVERFGHGEPARATTPIPAVSRAVTADAHRCTECGTEYTPLYGDPLGKIAAGTPFEELPATWRCPTCEAPILAYRLVPRTAA